jgi:hypothetical protein
MIILRLGTVIIDAVKLQLSITRNIRCALLLLDADDLRARFSRSNQPAAVIGCIGEGR